MPGPAPPSASYNLKIVDSSDEEDDESQDEELEEFQRQVQLQEQKLEQMREEPFCLEESHTPPHYRSDSMEVSTCSTSPPKKKKKKKKNKKKKKKDNGPAKVLPQTNEIPKTKSVSFDKVSLYSFQRCLGPDVVPYDGGWPLGLSEAVGKPETIPIDDYERTKQERLRIRAKEKGIDMDIQDDTILETRQWDYKHKRKNPLFHLLIEDQRMEILLRDSTPMEDDPDDALSNNSSHHGASSPNNKRLKRRDSPNKKNNQPNTRTRSQSFSQQGERYNDTYTQVLVHHVRNELEEIRFQRTGDGHIGCRCRKLDVYLPPPGAGKSHNKRRISVKKLKDELKKRHLLPTQQKTREELEVILHDAVEKEACCSGQDCPCSRNGIECQADICSCWHDSHQTKQGANTYCSVPEIQARCGNNNGMYAIDLKRIDATREEILKRLKAGQVVTCSPVSSDDNPKSATNQGVLNSFVSMVMG